MSKDILQGSNDIHIALGFDNYYIVHIYAMLASIMHNNKDNNVTFHAIAPAINEPEKEGLRNFINKSNSKIIFYEIKDNLLKKYVVLPEDSYFTIATFYKWLFPSLTDPGLRKLLYLDPDIVVIGNLRELYNLDIGNAPIAAVTDQVISIREDLSIKEPGKYFNAGVMLMDLKNWREQNITERALKFVKEYPGNLIYLDQDALNATLVNNWYKLSNKYNFTLSDVKLQVPVKELVKNVVIVHFTSHRKPWNALSRNKLRFLYHYYLKLSPKSQEKKYTDFKWDIKSIWTFTRIRVKEFYFNYKLDQIIPIKKWMISSLDY